MTPATDFLIRLRKIDQAGLTVRDVVILYAIMSKPGMNGTEVTDTIGIENRSSIQTSFPRMERLGLIEDRRTKWGRTNPSNFHATPAGVAFWNEIKPA